MIKQNLKTPLSIPSLKKIALETLKTKEKFKNITLFPKIPIVLEDTQTGELADLFFEIDACNEDFTILCEVYPGQDDINAAQKRKLMTDILKLIQLENLLNEKYGKLHREKYLILLNESIKESLIGKNKTAWASIGLSTFDIQIEVVEISKSLS